MLVPGLATNFPINALQYNCYKSSNYCIWKGWKTFVSHRNPVTQYLPVNNCKIGEPCGLYRFVYQMFDLLPYLVIYCFYWASGFSNSSEKLIDVHNYVGTLNNELDLVFVIGPNASQCFFSPLFSFKYFIHLA